MAKENPEEIIKELESNKKMSQDEIKEAIAKLDMKAGDQAKEAFSMLLERAMASNMVPKAALGVSDEMMESMYAHAYNLYNQGMYEESSYMFRMLILLDISELKYFMGMAACLHMMEDYENAIRVYSMLGLMSDHDPLPFYHASDCYMKLEQPLAARLMLQQALRECEGRSEHKMLAERIQMMVESLTDAALEQEKEIAKELAESGEEVEWPTRETMGKKLGINPDK